MRFLCTVTTLLIVQCLNPGIYGQSPPYKLGALVFDQPSTVRVGESVKLKCEYFLYSVPDVESDLRISFVPNSNLSEGLKSAAKSTNFNFPQEVGTAHEDFGEVLEVSLCYWFPLALFPPWTPRVLSGCDISL